MEVSKTKGIKEKINMGDSPIPALLVKMAAPMIVAMVVNGIYYLADAAFVGWSVGGKGIAGLAVVFPVQMLIVALATMVGVGTASIVSLKLGTNKKEDAELTVKNSIIFSGMLAVFLSFLLMIFKSKILYLFGASEDIYKYANQYYSIIVPGLIFILLSFSGANTLRAEGKAGIVGIGMISGSILNIILDALFIFGFNMGAAGAALGTLLARIVVTMLYAGVYLYRKSIVNIFTPGWILKIKVIKKIILLGIGPFFNQIGFSILALVMNISLRYYGNVNDLAVYGVLSRIHIFVTMPLMGLAQGFQPVVGYNYGADRLNRVKKSVNYAAIYSLIIGIFMFILFMVIPDSILSLFTDDILVIKNGIIPLQISMMMVPIIGLHLLSYFYFMAIDRPIKAMLISLFRQVIFLLPLICILPLFMGKKGIWIAYPVADIISVAIAFILLYNSAGIFNIQVLKNIIAKSEK